MGRVGEEVGFCVVVFFKGFLLGVLRFFLGL